jgi:hypothetical protein
MPWNAAVGAVTHCAISNMKLKTDPGKAHFYVASIYSHKYHFNITIIYFIFAKNLQNA